MTNKKVPHQNLFKLAQKYSMCSTYILIGSTVLSIASSNIFCQSFANISTYLEIINGCNSILIFSFIVFEILVKTTFFKAERKRRLDFIDNSFGTKLSGLRSEGYFTNDDIGAGVIKTAANCFENSFFTFHITALMKKNEIFKATLIIIVFITSSVFGNKNIVNLIIQLSLPILLIQNAFTLVSLNRQIESILDSFKMLFNDLDKKTSINNKLPSILNLILNYETTLAWGGILLDSKIFNRNNEKLSTEWLNLKSQYRLLSTP